MAARKFDQTSTFGGLMDMVTDRCSTTGLLCVLVREFAHVGWCVLVRIFAVSNRWDRHLLVCMYTICI